MLSLQPEKAARFQIPCPAPKTATLRVMTIYIIGKIINTKCFTWKKSRMPRKQRILGQMPSDLQSASISRLPPISFKIAKRLQSFIDAFNIDTTPENIEFLKSCYSQPECPEINYDDLALSFSHLYFFENFWKSISVFLQEPPQ
jgi:hypothetical protein